MTKEQFKLFKGVLQLHKDNGSCSSNELLECSYCPFINECSSEYTGSGYFNNLMNTISTYIEERIVKLTDEEQVELYKMLI